MKKRQRKSVAWRWLYIWYKILLIYISFNFDLNTAWVAVLYQIYKHEPKSSGCISDTTWTLMLYIDYDTPTSKCSCTVVPLISFVISSWIINEYYKYIYFIQ